MARTPSSGGLDIQIDLQILATLQDIASVLKSGRGASVLPGRGNKGGGNDLLADLAHLSNVIGDVVRTVKIFGEALSSLAQSLTAFTSAQFGLGSSTATTGMLMTLGRSLGINDIAGLGASVHGASLSGLGLQTASRYGIQYRPYETGGGTDRGDMLMKVIEGLRMTSRTRGGGAAIGEARSLGAESLLPLTLVSEKSLQGLREQNRLMERVFAPKQLAAAAEFNLSMAKLSQTFDATKTLFLAALIPAIEFVNQKLIELLTLMASVPGPGGADARTALKEYNASLNANTAELRRMNGYYGRGDRLRGALPGAFSQAGPGMLDQALRGHHMRVGAYSIGL